MNSLTGFATKMTLIKFDAAWLYPDDITIMILELSMGRMDPRVGSGRSGRVTILPNFGGSGQHFGFYSV